MNFGQTASAAGGLGTGGSPWGGSGTGAAGTSLATLADPSKGLSTEFSADNPVRMPVYNSPAQLAAARMKLNEITGRSGRTSTALVNAPGASTYSASFLGSQPGSAK